MAESKFPRHTGGGWVETSDSQKHRGWDKARAHQTLLDGPAKTGRKQIDRPREKARAHVAAKAAAPTVTVVQQKVVARVSESWARSEWQSAHMPEALRFSQDGVAWLTIERGGERIEVDFFGPSGPYKEPVANIVRQQPDFEVTDETRKVEVAP